jgi:hypothetical protein
MKIDLSQLNWAAIAVAGAAAFMLGGIWYSALFGKLWVRYQGWDEAKVAAIKTRMSPASFLGGMVVCYLILAFTLDLLVIALDLRTASAGACLAGIIWIGPAAAIGFTAQLASGGRHIGVYLLDVAFQVVALVAQGVILAAWR